MLKREKETGDYQAIRSAPKQDRHKIKDWQKFREFVQQHGDKTQAQLAKLWGENVTQQNISDGLRKIGFSRKKKTYSYRERDELKHQAFQAQLKSKSAAQIVYVDEAGLIIDRSTPMVTARLGNALVPLNQANAPTGSVGLPRSSKGDLCPDDLYGTV